MSCDSIRIYKKTPSLNNQISGIELLGQMNKSLLRGIRRKSGK